MNSTHHLVLTIDPDSPYAWDKVTLRDPISHEQPDLAKLIAEHFHLRGQYLIKVSIEVESLNAQPLP